MKTEDKEIHDGIIFKHKLANRLVELTKDVKKINKELALTLPTTELIAIGKALAEVDKLFQEMKKKYPSIAKTLDKIK